MKTKDKTVYQNLSSCGFGGASNVCCIDVLDGKIVRTRPVHYDEKYTPEELNEWSMTVRGHTFRPGMKTLIPPLSIGYKKRTYSPNRVPCPLIRVDWDKDGERNPQNRGLSGYRRISWDEATTIVAEEIERIRTNYGLVSILVQGEGHGETKAVSGAHGCNALLLNNLGDGYSPYTVQARQPDSWEGWYWGAKHVWGCETHGQQNPEDMVIIDASMHSDAILFWGADPETTPWGWGGLLPSRLCYWFSEIGIKSIHISPDLNYTGCIHADKWIPVYPNTDAALQLAIAYVWMTEGLYEKEYIATHSIGFDWFEYYVLGREDGVPKTPAWAAEKCGVPSYRIKAFARYWAKHLVSIAHCNGGGYIRSCFSHEPARLEVYLLGMQGLGRPGVNQFKFIEWVQSGANPVPYSKIYPVVQGGYHGWTFNPLPSHLIPKTMTPEAITNPPIEWYGHTFCNQPRTDQFKHFTYPEEGCERIHMIWSDTPCWETCWNGGNSYVDAIRHESIEFYLVQHPWMENDTLLADLILPISTVFELDDIAADVYSGQYNKIIYEEHAIEPVGDSAGDWECVLRIAQKLGKLYPEKYGNVYEDMTKGRHTPAEDIKVAYEKSGVPLDEYPYEKFIEEGYFCFPIDESWKDMHWGWIDFYNDPEGHPLKTPSGKLEYYCPTLAQLFPDDHVRGPVAHWIDEADGHCERMTSARAKDYPYLLVSNHPHWRVHAQHDDITWLREIPTCKVKGPDGYLYEPIWVNPLDAEKLGLKDGDVAKLFNERGAVLGGVYVTERIMPGVLYQDHGARCDAIVSGVGGLDRGGANNLICPTATTSKNCAGEVTNGFLVGIEKVDILMLAQQYPEAFGRDYDAAAGMVATSRIVKEG